MHLVLIGDSIFDNASYVSEGESVSDLLALEFPEAKISLLAVDGGVTTDVFSQLKWFPKDATNIFISCGGNDALRSIGILDEKVATVGDGLDILYLARESFRSNYVSMLESILSLHAKVSACTIYNKVPGLSERALIALAIFNEVILEELSVRNVPIIDLRVICNESVDYSEISPIEPSRNGGEKIAKSLAAIIAS